MSSAPRSSSSSSGSEQGPPLPLSSLLFSPLDQAALRRGLDRYYDFASRALVTEYVALRKAEKAADVMMFKNVSCRPSE